MPDQAGPKRVRVDGDLFHGQVPDDAVYVGRQAPGHRRSPWANPFVQEKTTPADWPPPFGGVHVRDLEHAVNLFRQFAYSSPEFRQRAREELAGRDLACWCRLQRPGSPPVFCHADVLLEIANGQKD